jgi:hypothetical protein
MLHVGHSLSMVNATKSIRRPVDKANVLVVVQWTGVTEGLLSQDLHIERMYG